VRSDVEDQAHEAQMIAAVKQMEDCREAQEAKRLRDDNARLRKLVADLSLDKEALQSVIEQSGWSSQR
jgi:mannose-6-phosphate isomerase class I